MTIRNDEGSRVNIGDVVWNAGASMWTLESVNGSRVTLASGESRKTLSAITLGLTITA